MKTISTLLLLISSLVAVAAEETVTYRITGLFAPAREAVFRATVDAIPDVKLLSVDFEHAEGVFQYDPAVAFKGTKPQEIPQRLNQIIAGATRATLGVAPADSTPKAQLTQVEIPIAGLDCQACCLAAYESVFKIDGVTAATASFREHRLVALVDPARTNRDALIAALKKRRVDVTEGAP